MRQFDPSLLNKLYIPSPSSHKGQNGKLLIIGGSKLFHAASLWSLEVASKIVDMVFYSSIPENNKIISKIKTEFRNGIVVPRSKIDNYIKEADCVLIGPGLVRMEKSKILNSSLASESRRAKSETNSNVLNINDIDSFEDEGEQTHYLTKYVLEKYPNKRFVLDAGSLQMMNPSWLLSLNQTPILTPHHGEFEMLVNKIKDQNAKIKMIDKKETRAEWFAREFNCIVLLKGKVDIVCPPAGGCMEVSGGNAGMTKGGTGDVLAGLAAALYCKNDAFLSAAASSYINKKAGDALFEKVGYYFNASDLVKQIPFTLKEELGL